MTSRIAHRMALCGDRDVLHAAAVTLATCVLSAGLVYVGYFVHVLRTARNARCVPEGGDCVLLFGKHAPHGQLDRDFEARLDRAVSLWHGGATTRLVLLGGGAPDQPSEAEIARDGLFARGLAVDTPLWLESRSRDTLQNLRNARDLLAASAHAQGARQSVTLLSSRYHLARCALFAGQLGFNARLCAAEPTLVFGPRMLGRIATEAAYVCLTDVGSRWARLIGHKRMLARIS